MAAGLRESFYIFTNIYRTLNPYGKWLIFTDSSLGLSWFIRPLASRWIWNGKKNKLWKFTIADIVKMESYKEVTKLPGIIDTSTKRHQTLSGNIFSSDNLSSNSDKIHTRSTQTKSVICLMSLPLRLSRSLLLRLPRSLLPSSSLFPPLSQLRRQLIALLLRALSSLSFQSRMPQHARNMQCFWLNSRSTEILLIWPNAIFSSWPVPSFVPIQSGD